VSGEALVGRDPVRTYEVAQRDGEIFIDVSDPSAGEQRARALSGIEAATSDNDRPRIAREMARLEHAGFDATETLVHAFRLCNARFGDGMTHAHAAAADWSLLASRAGTAAILDGDLPAELDDSVGWQAEIVGQVGRVALHRGKYRLHPSGQSFRVVPWRDCLMPDIVRDV
jgi:hypothetical protein